MNQSSVKYSYQHPRMDEGFYSLRDARTFTTLDAYSGYWQVPISPEQKQKMAFVFHAGTFQYKVMSLGLTNKPANFQRVLNLNLTKFKWKTCLIYLNYVIIFSKAIEDFIKHPDEILHCIKAGFTLKIKK